jgi:hypothetical protein
MRGDFSRDTFDPTEHYTRVLLKQGRVSLDADFNEQASILLHRMQAFTADMLGIDSYSGAGPASNLGFLIAASNTAGDFTIGRGRYYVNGILVENEEDCSYLSQPDYPVPVARRLTGVTGTYIAYLDVWERHVTALEEPEIREVALGGPDTASRAEVVWQVKLLSTNLVGNADKKAAAAHDLRAVAAKATTAAALKAAAKAAAAPAASGPTNPTFPITLLTHDFPIPFGLEMLRARATPDPADTDPCSIPPANRYRGPENQLYRVEIHQGGLIGDKPTFKWSRENGSVTFPILKIASDATSSTTTLFLASLGKDQKLGLSVGDWVEIVDDVYGLQNLSEPLLQVTAVSLDDLSVTLNGLRATGNRGDDPAQLPLLRRWDQSGPAASLINGAVPITEGAANVDANWITLEDGVQILFDSSAIAGGISFYRTGDYWLIPARVATGDVEWPKDASGVPEALPPRGVEHQFVGLATISVANGTVTVTKDSRSFFDILAKPMP